MIVYDWLRDEETARAHIRDFEENYVAHIAQLSAEAAFHDHVPLLAGRYICEHEQFVVPVPQVIAVYREASLAGPLTVRSYEPDVSAQGTLIFSDTPELHLVYGEMGGWVQHDYLGATVDGRWEGHWSNALDMRINGPFTLRYVPQEPLKPFW